jgi:hypothetical protein
VPTAGCFFRFFLFLCLRFLLAWAIAIDGLLGPSDGFGRHEGGL